MLKPRIALSKLYMLAQLEGILVSIPLILRSRICLLGLDWNKWSTNLLLSVLSASKLKLRRWSTLNFFSLLPIPDYAWQVVTLDFIEGLPCSKNYNCILVVVEKLSKYAHFVALSLPFTAFKVAMLYMDNIYKLHGLPQVLISDRDRICWHLILTSKIP
jgi:hypothetical protein